MAKTKIQWATDSWNPTTGCDPVSAGCDHCYAKRMATRLRGRYGYPQDEPFKVTLHPDRLEQPLRWCKPRMIFVGSMGDFWHPQVPLTFQCSMLNVMVKCPQHTFIILTKRHDQLAIFNYVCGWSAESYPNIWLGVSVEDQKTADERIPILLQVPAAVRVVSIEPMLEAIDLSDYLDCGHETGGPQGWQPDPSLDWIICGGETGPGARPMNPEWPRQVRDQCVEAGVPFFFKQWGEWSPKYTLARTLNVNVDGRIEDPKGYPCISVARTGRDGWHSMFRVTKKQAGRKLDGRVWDQYPGGQDE